MPKNGETRPSRAERVLPHGDPQRLGALLSDLEPRLTAVALRLTRNRETARDVVQTAFEKAIRHGAGFRGSSRVSTWMHRIVANEALMSLRAERRRAEVQPVDLEDLAAADAGPGPAEQLVRRERAARLRDGIARLPRDDRDVMLRCVLAGRSYAEYAARTGSHPAAVKSRAFRARRRLSGMLQEA